MSKKAEKEVMKIILNDREKLIRELDAFIKEFGGAYTSPVKLLADFAFTLIDEKLNELIDD